MADWLEEARIEYITTNTSYRKLIVKFISSCMLASLTVRKMTVIIGIWFI